MARSRKFATWTYRDAETGERVEVECRSTTESSYSHATTTFSVHLPAYDINEQGTDPNALRDRVFHELGARRTAEWAHHLRVFAGGDFSSHHGSDNFVKEGFDYVGIQGKLAVDVAPVKTSVRADGQPVWNRTGGAGCNARVGTPGTGPGSHQFAGIGSEVRGVYALVPDTPANRQALYLLVQKMRQLDDQLRTFLNPARIQATLDHVARTNGVLPALPAPAKEEKDDAKPGGKPARRKPKG